MDLEAAGRVTSLFESRGQLDRISQVGYDAALTCLARAEERLKAASVLAEAQLWESAFTAAHDAYRTAADAVVLLLSFRVPATQGGHRIATDIAHAALMADAGAFAPADAERFRQGRHESEYFDPARPVDKTSADSAWAVGLASAAVAAASAALSGG